MVSWTSLSLRLAPHSVSWETARGDSALWTSRAIGPGGPLAGKRVAAYRTVCDNRRHGVRAMGSSVQMCVARVDLDMIMDDMPNGQSRYTLTSPKRSANVMIQILSFVIVQRTQLVLGNFENGHLKATL